MSNSFDYEAIVIGGGFGGSVMAARLGRRWPGRVAVLEQGRDYPLGSFPRTPAAMADNFWCPDSAAPRATRAPQRRSGDVQQGLGLFDIRRFRHIDTLTAAGVGGGSLIFANVILAPPAASFSGWPAGISLERLSPYYDVVQRVLGARPLPPAQPGERRYVQRQGAFVRFAAHSGLHTRPADLSVFFGRDYSYGGQMEPTPMGIQETNPWGARQSSCTYCGECNVGCNIHAKNSTDLNYLYVAQQRSGVRVLTLARTEQIVALDAAGEADASADGHFGYRVTFRQLDDGVLHSLTSRRVIVCGGTLGTTELLLRCRDVHHSLPRLSRQLGCGFSGNGDFVTFVLDSQRPINSTFGPVISQLIDHQLYQTDAEGGTAAFLVQDASFPAAAAWAVAALQPVMHPLQRGWRLLRLLTELARAPGRGGQRRLGEVLQRGLAGDLSQCSAVLLFMGRDQADGRLSLNRDGWLELDWRVHDQRALYRAMLDVSENFRQFTRARRVLPFPGWLWPRRRSISVHPLGGCRLAETPAQGVCSAHAHERGQVFGYHGLYVADGSLMPGALGSNPAASIAALAEWIAHGITGITPEADLHA